MRLWGDQQANKIFKSRLILLEFALNLFHGNEPKQKDAPTFSLHWE